jgi:hypothetical protein
MIYQVRLLAGLFLFYFRTQFGARQPGIRDVTSCKHKLSSNMRNGINIAISRCIAKAKSISY